MTALFISHRSTDSALAQALKDWLARQGHEQLFLDFDPEDGIPAGVDWEQRLYQELRRCQAVLVVLTPAWLESGWCRSELHIAREKGKAVFVVRAKPGAGGPLPSLQEVDLTVDRQAALTRLARGLKEHGLNPADSFDWKPGRPIYPGLAALDVEDAAVFFGRSEESWDMVERLRRMRLQAVGSPKLLLLTGASGSGKSSLMRAGVLPRLGKELACWIVPRPFRRGSDARAALAVALAGAFPNRRLPLPLESADDLLAIAAALRQALARPDATLVLALDQAEEVLAAEHAEDSTWLLDLLRDALARSGAELLVLATIRSDRAGAWQQHAAVKAAPGRGELGFEMVPLGPIPLERIGEIVRGPARHEGLRIDDELVQAILTDTDTPDALPLLAYTLRFMHDRFAGNGRLTLAEYRSFGGLEGSIRTQADAAIAMDRLSETEREALHDAFVPGLVRATAEAGFVRGRARLDSLPSRAEPLLRRLIDQARLLQTDRDAKGHETIEVTHEALLRVWPTLAGWLREDGTKLRRLEALQRAALDWTGSERSADYLVHRVYRLGDAEALAAEPRFQAQLTEADRAYLAACRDAQTRSDAAEAAGRERELRRRTTQVRVAAGVGVVLAGFAAAVVWQFLVAREQSSAAREAGRATVVALIQARDQLQRADKATAEATRQLGRANEALAAGIWNDLDFEGEGTSINPSEAKALWTLSTGGDALKAAFMTQLWSNRERQQRFARRPGVVARALGLAWPSPDQTRAGFQTVLTIRSDDPTEPSSVLAGMLARSLPADDLIGSFTTVLARMGEQMHEGEWAMVCQTARLLAERLSETETPRALGLALDTLKADAGPRQSLCAAGTLAPLTARVGPELAAKALPSVIAAMAVEGAEPATLRELARAVAALRIEPTGEQTGTMAAAVARSVGQGARGEALYDAARALVSLPAPLTAAQTDAVLGSTLSEIKRVIVPSREPPELRLTAMQAATKALMTLAPKLAPDQARSALIAAMTAMEDLHGTALGPPLASVLAPLAARLSPEQANAVFPTLLATLASLPDASVRASAAPAVLVLARALPDAAVEDTLQPVIPKMARGEGPDEPPEAEAAILLARRLPAGRGTALGPAVLDGLRSTLGQAAIRALADVIEAASVPVTQAEMQEAIDRLTPAKDVSEFVHHGIPALRALAGQFTADQAKGALELILANAASVHDAEGAVSLADAAVALAGQLPADIARPIVAASIRDLADDASHEPLLALVQALPPPLTEAARRDALLPALAKLAPLDRDPFHAVPLAQTIVALDIPLTPEQGRAALGLLARAAAQPTGMGRVSLAGLQRVVRFLAAPVPAAERAAVIAPINEGWRVEAKRTAPALRRAELLAAIIRAIDVPPSTDLVQLSQEVVFKGLLKAQAPDLFQGLTRAILGTVPEPRLAPLLDAAMAGLAWSDDEPDAQKWASGLAELLVHAERPVRLDRIVAALRYPIAAGAATDVLLDALHMADPSFPGREGGLPAALRWLEQADPGFDLTKPPQCPPPQKQGTSCPAQTP